MTNTERPGQRFQEFVALLERVFAHEDDVTIHSPLRLIDKDTGKKREHDVVIVRKGHHGDTLTAVECKDHSRLIGVQTVEGFSRKCEKTGVHHGIIVSAKGFTATARTKAAALNIGLTTLAEAETFDWIGTKFLVGCTRQYHSIDFHIECKPTGDAAPVNPIQSVHLKDGSLLTGDIAQAFLNEHLPAEVFAGKFDGPRYGELTAPAEGAYLTDATGNRFDVATITMRYSVEEIESDHDFQLHRFEGGKDFEIASGVLNLPGLNATVMMIRSKDGINVSLATTPTKG